MWPFQKAAEPAPVPRRPKGTVDFDQHQFETHREFAGNHPLGTSGFLTLVEYSLNKNYRHCRIGKIVLKSS